MKLEFSEQILEKSLILKFMKILSVGTELFDVDGWTDAQKTR